MFLHRIHDVFVNAVGARRFSVVSVHVFSDDITKKSAGFREALPCTHDNDVIVVNEGRSICGYMDGFHCCFPRCVPCAGAIPVSNFANPE
jgi:hypothetical protein